ncbi:S8 family serine peptidase [Mycoplasmopsis agassizii]|uniref:S8 family serine peptidase n=1 Tax=Mycoplasmopsis agassizii TaxID=33922 RepID=UPI0035270411
MAKAILSVANIVSASVLPIQTVSTVQTENANNHLQNYDFENLFKITRNGYDEKLRLSRLNQSVEVLVRIKDHVDFSEYEKTQDVTPITEQYILQNQNFVNSIEGSLLDLSFYSISKTTPYITFVFKNRENLEGNLLLLASKENSVSVNSYEDSELDAAPKNTSSGSTLLSYQYNYKKSTNEKQFEMVGALGQRQKDALIHDLQSKYSFKNNVKKIKVGVVEARENISQNNILFKNNNLHFYNKNGISQQRLEEIRHADKVSTIIAGSNGLDTFIEDIYSVYINNIDDSGKKPVVKSGTVSQWLEKFDWLISSGVKVINNSHAIEIKKDRALRSKILYGYSEKAYYMDFIARKYGIINVFSAGNEGYDDDVVAVSYTLSHNSVTVGGTDYTGDKLSMWSQYKFSDNKILTKPLVVAPGEDYWYPSFEKNDDFLYGSEWGTSLAAPVVTGLITMLLRNNYNLFGKPEAILAILTAGSKQMNGYDDKKANGLNEMVGAGLVNYELMQKAADNIQSIHVNENNMRQEISLPKLIEGQTLSISTAWLFDAGYLEIPEFNPSLDKNSTAYKNFNKTHTSFGDDKYKNNWNSIDYLKEKYGENWYIPTDINLYLEKWNEHFEAWEEVSNSSSLTSNVEFIRLRIKESGKYRVVIKQNGPTKSKTDTKGAITYVIT